MWVPQRKKKMELRGWSIVQWSLEYDKSWFDPWHLIWCPQALSGTVLEHRVTQSTPRYCPQTKKKKRRKEMEAAGVGLCTSPPENVRAQAWACSLSRLPRPHCGPSAIGLCLAFQPFLLGLALRLPRLWKALGNWVAGRGCWVLINHVLAP